MTCRLGGGTPTYQSCVVEEERVFHYVWGAGDEMAQSGSIGEDSETYQFRMLTLFRNPYSLHVYHAFLRYVLDEKGN